MPDYPSGQDGSHAACLGFPALVHRQSAIWPQKEHLCSLLLVHDIPSEERALELHHKEHDNDP